MQLTWEKRGQILLVRIKGELDLDTARTFKSELEDRIAAFAPRYLLLDLNELDFIDSSGLGIILGQYRRLKKKGGELGIYGLSSTVERVFELAGLCENIRVFASEQEALKKLDQGGLSNDA